MLTSDVVEEMAKLVLEARLDEANAGVPPLLQDRDPSHLVRILCSDCGELIRYEVWDEPEPKGEHVSYYVCYLCSRKKEDAISAPPRAL